MDSDVISTIIPIEPIFEDMLQDVESEIDLVVTKEEEERKEDLVEEPIEAKVEEPIEAKVEDSLLPKEDKEVEMIIHKKSISNFCCCCC